jgi:hypothetical protein
MVEDEQVDSLNPSVSVVFSAADNAEWDRQVQSCWSGPQVKETFGEGEGFLDGTT